MNDTQRLIVALVVSAGLMLLYGVFFGPEKQAPQQQAQQQQTQTTAQPAAKPAPQAGAPAPAAPSPAAPPAAGTAAAPAAAPKAPVAYKKVVVENQLATYVFSERGGGLKKITLKKYYNQPGKKGGNYDLLNLAANAPLSLGLNLPRLDDHLAKRQFEASADRLEVSEGKPASLSFTITSAGLKIVKTYTFKPNAYDFNLTVKITNTNGQVVEFRPELILSESPNRGGKNSYAFNGVQVYNNKSLEEIDVGDLKDKPVQQGDIKWMTMNIPYFMGAVIPLDDKAQGNRTMRGFADKDIMTGSLLEPTVKLNPNQDISVGYEVFYGPRDLEIIKPLGHKLDAAIDFGWFDIIAKPMLTLLNWLFAFFGNYGIAIIIVTILTKIIFWPLAAKSYKSMKQMQKLQPQVAKLRAKYKGDKQRMNQEMMQLYKTYKVNPMGGCLPMVVQIPVFIAFYKVLGAYIGLRHAPFMLWINDLSAPDRLFPDLGIPYVGGIPVLTLIMGASMLVQQKMTPTPGDPTQAKMMMLMPVVFTFMFINFPSGLVLYWLVNNVLGIAQQFYTNKLKA